MKLIILYGFAASGKSALAKLYADRNPMTIAIEGDQLIGMIGGWRKNESAARGLVFEYIKSIADIHLQGNKDVMIPYLLNDASHSKEFQKIANKHNAEFFEVYIEIEKIDAVARLISRGGWGEEGSRSLTENDREELEGRFDYMVNVMNELPSTISIKSELNNIESTYQNLASATDS